MLKCISTAQARAKCVSAFWAQSGLRPFACKFLSKVALLMSLVTYWHAQFLLIASTSFSSSSSALSSSSVSSLNIIILNLIILIIPNIILLHLIILNIIVFYIIVRNVIILIIIMIIIIVVVVLVIIITIIIIIISMIILNIILHYPPIPPNCLGPLAGVMFFLDIPQTGEIHFLLLEFNVFVA